MELTSEAILEPASGIALSLATGQRLRVVDLEGQRVVDMAVFNADNPREKLSTSYSRTRAGFAAAARARAEPNHHFASGAITRHSRTYRALGQRGP